MLTLNNTAVLSVSLNILRNIRIIDRCDIASACSACFASAIFILYLSFHSAHRPRFCGTVVDRKNGGDREWRHLRSGQPYTLRIKFSIGTNTDFCARKVYERYLSFRIRYVYDSSRVKLRRDYMSHSELYPDIILQNEGEGLVLFCLFRRLLYSCLSVACGKTDRTN